MTPRYPGARFFGHRGQGGTCRPRSCSWHEAVTTARSVAGWNETAGACHGFTADDGDAEQYTDFDVTVAGVYEDNPRVLTWENYDGLLPSTNRSPDGSFGPNDRPFSPRMFERNADIMAWMVDGLGIPLHLMEWTNESGHGPHRLGVPNPSGNVRTNYGPAQWTRHPGKQCPGDQRILQLPAMLARAQVILEAVRAGRCTWLPTGPVDLPAALARTAGTNPTPTTGDGELSAADVNRIINEIRYGNDKVMEGKGAEKPVQNIKLVRQEIASLRKEVAAIAAAVAKLPKS